MSADTQVVSDTAGNVLGTIRPRGTVWHARDNEGNLIGSFRTRERAEAAIRGTGR